MVVKHDEHLEEMQGGNMKDWCMKCKYVDIDGADIPCCDCFSNFDEMPTEFKAKKRCSFGDGVTIKPDGIHEVDPCVYEEVETVKHCTVHVMRCKRCGHMEFMWEREQP